MEILTTVIGMAVYTLVGLLFMELTYAHVKDLEAEVEKIDPRYCKRLWYCVSIKKTTLNQILADILFITVWPVICVMSILKAEWNYDLIVNHSAFTKKNGSRY
jgi:hypothetical protein